MIDKSKTRAQMWTSIVMLALTCAGLCVAAADGASWVVLTALVANATTWAMVAQACREDLKVPKLSPLNLAIKSDRVVLEEKPLRRRA